MPLLTHRGRDKIATISQKSFTKAFSLMKMYEFCLRFHLSLFLRVQLTVFTDAYMRHLASISQLQRLTCFRTLISNYIHSFTWIVISHLCPNCSVGLTEALLRSGNGWISTLQSFILIESVKTWSMWKGSTRALCKNVIWITCSCFNHDAGLADLWAPFY